MKEPVIERQHEKGIQAAKEELARDDWSEGMVIMRLKRRAYMSPLVFVHQEEQQQQRLLQLDYSMRSRKAIAYQIVHPMWYMGSDNSTSLSRVSKPFDAANDVLWRKGITVITSTKNISFVSMFSMKIEPNSASLIERSDSRNTDSVGLMHNLLSRPLHLSKEMTSTFKKQDKSNQLFNWIDVGTDSISFN